VHIHHASFRNLPGHTHTLASTPRPAHLAVLARQVAAPHQPGEEGQQGEAAQHAGQDDDIVVNDLLLLGVDWRGWWGLQGSAGQRRAASGWLQV
jgi:hypothetical protein